MAFGQTAQQQAIKLYDDEMAFRARQPIIIQPDPVAAQLEAIRQEIRQFSAQQAILAAWPDNPEMQQWLLHNRGIYPASRDR